MALSKIPRDNQNFFKVVESLFFESPPVLLSAFEWVSGKDPAQSFKDFFLVEKQMPMGLYKKYFNKGQRDKMESDPSGKSFDVTLFFVMFKVGCARLSQNQDDWKEGNDTSLESTVTMFKNLRNFILHLDVNLIADDAQMMDCLDKIQKYLEQILRLSAQYSSEGKLHVDDKVKKMKESVQKIKDSKITPCDIAEYKAKIQELREAQKQIVEREGVSELKQEYKNLSSITPLSCLTEIGSLDVESIYTDTETVREKAGQTHISPVDSKEILVLRSDGGEKPNLILVEGDAGAGKSTLTKKILSDWTGNVSQGPSSAMQGIHSYDLIVYSEFRNRNISSGLSLLKVLLPQTSNALQDEDLIQSVCDLNTLVVLDGWDEENEASKQLMWDLLGNFLPRSKGKMELLITTRPNKLPDLPNVSQGKPKLHIRLTGVRHGKQLDFVKKLHEELRKEGHSAEQTEPLVEYVQRASVQMGDHFSLPLNLALVTYLWARNPSKVNSSTTVAELYTELQEMMKTRLIERLQKRGISGTWNELDNNCKEFLKTLYRVCFETHASGSVQLSPKHVKDLEDKCKELQLPPDEMCSTFLNVTKTWTPSGYKLSLEAPHKSILEFFAALYIFFALQETQDEKDFQESLQKFPANLTAEETETLRKIFYKNEGEEVSIISIFQKEFGANLSNETFDHFQESLIILGGLLTIKDPQSATKYAPELVHLMNRITFGDEETKVRTAFKLVSNMKNNDVLVDAVVNIMMKGVREMGIRDGHCRAAVAILKRRKSFPSLEMIKISISSDGKLIPELEALMDEVSTTDCKVSLYLDHHWRNQEDGSHLVRRLLTKNRRCRVVHLRTHLEDPCLIPPEAKVVRLSLRGNIPEMLEELGRHERYYINIRLSLSHPLPHTHSLTPLHRGRGTQILILTDVSDGDSDRVVQLLRALQPLDDDDGDDDDDDGDDDDSGRYFCIHFPRSSLTRSGIETLLCKMAQEDVRVGGSLFVSSSSIPPAEETELQDVCRQHLKCGFNILDDEMIWRYI